MGPSTLLLFSLPALCLGAIVRESHGGCSSDDECNSRFNKYLTKNPYHMKCCTTIVCNPNYKYYIVTSGCTAHGVLDCLKLSESSRTERFAARVEKSIWDDRRDSMFNKCEDTKQELNVLVPRLKNEYLTKVESGKIKPPVVKRPITRRTQRTQRPRATDPPRQTNPPFPGITFKGRVIEHGNGDKKDSASEEEPLVNPKGPDVWPRTTRRPRTRRPSRKPVVRTRRISTRPPPTRRSRRPTTRSVATRRPRTTRPRTRRPPRTRRTRRPTSKRPPRTRRTRRPTSKRPPRTRRTRPQAPRTRRTRPTRRRTTRRPRRRTTARPLPPTDAPSANNPAGKKRAKGKEVSRVCRRFENFCRETGKECCAVLNCNGHQNTVLLRHSCEDSCSEANSGNGNKIYFRPETLKKDGVRFAEKTGSFPEENCASMRAFLDFLR